MADFAAISDLEAFLQVEISGDATKEAAANRALNEATEAIRNYCRQYLELVSNDEVTLDVLPGRQIGPIRLLLPELPVVAVSAVVEDGTTLTADEDYQLGDHGMLYRLDSRQNVGARWATGVQVVTITYSHGYETLPDDVVAVCTRAASRAYQSGLRAADSKGVLGVASKALGDFSVAYASESGGGVGEGVMGASAARMLLLSEKDILDRYRL